MIETKESCRMFDAVCLFKKNVMSTSEEKHQYNSSSNSSMELFICSPSPTNVPGADNL